MKKLSTTLFLALAITMLFISPARGRTITGKPRKFDLKYRVKYQNKSGRTADLKVVFPLVEKWSPHQVVKSIDVFPKSKNIKKQHNGQFAVVEVNKIPPGGEAAFGFNAVVETRRVIYDLDARKVTSKSPGDVKKYLEESGRFPTKHPRVKNLLNHIVSGETNRYYRVLRIYDYVRGLKFQLRMKPAPVLDVISSGACQCSDATDLFVTLCRSMGVPARYCAGMFLKENLTSTPDTHAWAEVYLHPYGWIPMDPTMGRFDKKTRLSRFAEIDAPYVLMWKDEANPFKVQSIKGGGVPSFSNFKPSITYKANGIGNSISIMEICPKFTLNLVKKPQINLMSSNSKACALYAGGNKALGAGDIAGAERQIRAALSLDPSFSLAWRKLIQIFEKKKMLPALRNEISSLKNRKDNKGAAFYALGVIDMLTGCYSRASVEFDRARNMGVDPFIINYNRGLLFLEAKQVSRSALYLDYALRQNPAGIPVYQELLDLMAYLEDHRGRIDLCRAGLKIMNSPFFHYEAAKAYLEARSYKNAEKSAQEAVRMIPNDPAYHGLLAMIYIESGDRASARKALDKAVQLGLPASQRKFLEGKIK